MTNDSETPSTIQDTLREIAGYDDYIARLAEHWKLSAVINAGVIDASIYEMATSFWRQLYQRMQLSGHVNDLADNDEKYVAMLVVDAAAVKAQSGKEETRE